MHGRLWRWAGAIERAERNVHLPSLPHRAALRTRTEVERLDRLEVAVWFRRRRRALKFYERFALWFLLTFAWCI